MPIRLIVRAHARASVPFHPVPRSNSVYDHDRPYIIIENGVPLVSPQQLRDLALGILHFDDFIQLGCGKHRVVLRRKRGREWGTVESDKAAY